MILFLALRNLCRNFRRTLAVVSTIALATGALLAFDGFINGVLGEMRENAIHSNYGYGQINTKGYREALPQDPKSQWIERKDELAKFLSETEGVKDYFQRASLPALIVKGSKTVSGCAQGIEADKEARFFNSLNINEGETLSYQENGILLGKGLANALDAHPGDQVEVILPSSKGVTNHDHFIVSGIFHTGTLEFDNHVFRIQLPAAQKLFDTQKIELVSLDVEDFSEWDALEEKIVTAFPELEVTPFHILDKFNYQNSADWLKALFNVAQIIILIIVLLGIFNTISTSILERKQEIGNLRANGESSFQVMQLVLIEGGLLAIIGSAIGMGLTYSILMLFVEKNVTLPPGPGQTNPFLLTFSFEWSMALYALGISGAVAMLASYFAGLKVVKMPIARALRST